jgi:hypothetical protein
VAAIAATTFAAAPGNAAFNVKVGAGAWSSRNVTQSAGCAGHWTATTVCEITADSEQVGTPGCKAGTLAVASDPNCRAVFTGELTLTGSGTEQEATLGEDTDVEIEVGPCAGLTLSGAEVQIHDPYAGDYVVYPRVVVSNAAWKITGNLIGLNVSTQQVVVLNVSATIKPGCTKVKLRNGDTVVRFAGLFTGSYQLL